RPSTTRRSPSWWCSASRASGGWCRRATGSPAPRSRGRRRSWPRPSGSWRALPDAPLPVLAIEDLRRQVEHGDVDTVLVAFTDMQGRLQGKRLHARYFLDVVLEHAT